MSNPELDPDCHMRKEDIAFHENRARGGLASVAIGLGIVDAIGRTHTKEVTLYDVMSLPSLREVASAMHHHNCNAVMELAHGGKYANARSHESSSDQCAIGPNDEVNPDGIAVRSMTEEDIYRVADCFAEGAKLVKEAGFDMVLIHGGHGWLLGQFMSPNMNHRTDQWGGSLENRMRFPLLVIEKIRQAVGSNFPIEYRMSGAEFTPGGYSVEEGIEMAKVLDGKVDIIHVSAGVHEDPNVFVITHPSMFIEHGCNVFLAAEIKKHVKTPVATLGGTPTTPKKVIVVGGDPGGMEAAVTAVGRGHSVTLYEKGSRLGGQLLSEEYIPFKQDMFNFVKVLEKRLIQAGVDVRLNTELTAEMAADLKADVIITAVGAKPVIPPIPGIDSENVVSLEALHQASPTLGQKVVILGGGLVGSKCAIYLDGLGKDVTIVEMKDDWAADSYFMHKNAMKVYMSDSKIKIQVNT